MTKESLDNNHYALVDIAGIIPGLIVGKSKDYIAIKRGILYQYEKMYARKDLGHFELRRMKECII